MNLLSPPRFRLYFGISSSERLDEFGIAYQERLVPLLEKYGLRDGVAQTPPIAPGIFSRIFALEDVSAIESIDRHLRNDLDWQQALHLLGDEFGSPRPDGFVLHGFGIYEIPAAPGQIAPLGPGKGNWHSYDVSDGLAGGQVRAIVEDQSGHLWFGCRGGVNRFDGHEWKTYTVADGLSNNSVQSLHCDRSGRIWCGTPGGLHHLDGDIWVIEDRISLVDNVVSSILEDSQGRLWCGTDKGLVCVDEREVTSYTTADGLVFDRVEIVYEDQNGVFWIGTQNGLSRFDGGEWTSFTTTTLQGLPGNAITSIAEDNEGALWVGTGQGGPARYNGSEWIHFNDSESLGDRGWTWSILNDRNGVLWFGSSRGIACYDGTTWKTTIPDEQQGSIGGWSLMEDREGNLWFGSSDRIYRYDRNLARYSSDDGLLVDGIKAVLEDRGGHLWFGGNNGLHRLDGETLSTYSTADGFLCDSIWEIVQHPDGTIWFATWRGAVRYDGHTFRNFTMADGLGYGLLSKHDNILSTCIDSRGYIWFGTQWGGLVRYDGEQFDLFTVEDGLANNNIQWICEDRDGAMWICCGGNDGISRYDGNEWRTYTTQDGLPVGLYSAIVQDREGAMWMGAEGGASRFDGETFSNLTREDGLTREALWSICEDREGHMWFGSSGGGVNRYDGQVMQSLSVRDGLANNQVHQILQDREGGFWFATVGGLTRFRPPSPVPPPVFIDAVVADRRYENADRVEIVDSVGLVAFEFSAISFKTHPESVVYRYRLEGLDTDWTNTHQRQVEYANLPAGSYAFEVVAVDRDLVYSRELATVSLQVVRDSRDVQIDELERRVRERTSELEQARQSAEEARDVAERANRAKSDFLANMSHEIRTPMNAILGYAQILKRNSELSGTQEHAVDTILGSGEHLLSLINEVLDLSKIEAGRLELEPVEFDQAKLVEGLGTMFELRCQQKGLSLRVELEGDNWQVRGDESKLRQVLVNLLGNAVKFTESGEVVLRVQAQGEALFYYEVRDTGPGIAPEQQEVLFEPFQQGVDGAHRGGTGLGLSIARRHVDLMGGQLEADSASGQGARFFFSLQLEPAQGPVTGLDEGASDRW